MTAKINVFKVFGDWYTLVIGTRLMVIIDMYTFFFLYKNKFYNNTEAQILRLEKFECFISENIDVEMKRNT